MAVPTRQTSEAQLNEFNVWMRSQPWFQAQMRAWGLDPSGYGNRKLTDAEQAHLERLLAQNGVPLPSGMHIDSGSSVNQKNTLGRNMAIGAAIGGGALTGLGLAGLGPLGGLGGGSAAASGAAGASGAASGAASGSIPTLASTSLTSGMGYGPASLAGTSALGGGAAAAAIPTIASRSLTNGMGYDPATLAGTGGALSGLASGYQSGRGFMGNLADGASDSVPDWLRAAFAGMAGLPGLLASQQGPSDEENALIAQAQRLLGQQEARTTFSDPLYKATMKMAYGLLPGNDGVYPGGE